MKVPFIFKKAITLSEAMITMVIFGIIGMVVIPIVLHANPNKEANATMAIKVAESIEQATVRILAQNSVFDDFTSIKDKHGHFSIEDEDAKTRMPELYLEMINFLDLEIDLSREYYSEELNDVRKNALGINLKDTYHSFFWNQTASIIGFRFYDDCTATEENANPPGQKGVFPVENVCASIFFDVNGYKKPNKIGSDQYILPVGKRGIVYLSE